MKIIEVSAAIIIKSNKIFITQRGYGDFKDMWEYPGGKIEPGETPEEALIREIKEELSADIHIKTKLTVIEYDYEKFHLIMHCFICELKSDHMSLIEHEAAKFVNVDELDKYNFLPADLELNKIIASSL